MEVYARRPNLLHLSGITLSDYVPVEDLFDEKVLEGAAREELPLDPLPYDKIPVVFTGLDDWPSSTNLLCWACPFSFDGPPRFAPTYIRQGERGRTEVGVEGNFCTFNCAARYIDTMYPPQAFPQKHWRMTDNLCTVYQMFTGRRVSHVPAAPSKTELRMFGGTLSEDQFWGAMRRLDQDHGLRDHRLGSVAPERTRPRAEEAGPKGPTMWEVGGTAPPPSLATLGSSPPSRHPRLGLWQRPPLRGRKKPLWGRPGGGRWRTTSALWGSPPPELPRSALRTASRPPGCRPSPAARAPA